MCKNAFIDWKIINLLQNADERLSIESMYDS